ncbi:hypothetical protein K1T71_011763 [Dendrolimus kikuchii]|uniref:Uncharacterized protein n=1 Tax=Dendrolimus kikuchii TaxID=765133 RepID=A0ACC1CLY9_9NEOP|nr:hypothetical protein K1T71_011763 [Dendrolimus kikuchii]
MHSILKIVVSMFLLSSVVASTYQGSAKLRRDGILNLYPFPRVGRATHRTWQLPFNDAYLDSDQIKRSSLVPFPRIGRRDLSMLRPEPLHTDQNPPTGVRRTGDSPGMWFGPRLGRSFQSEEDDITVQTDNNYHSDPELMEPIHEERVKRQAT